MPDAPAHASLAQPIPSSKADPQSSAPEGSKTRSEKRSGKSERNHKRGAEALSEHEALLTVRSETQAFIDAFDPALLGMDAARSQDEDEDESEDLDYPSARFEPASGADPERASILALALQRALASSLADIPRSEWGMPSTLWAVECRGGAAAVAASFRAARAFDPEIEPLDVSLISSEAAKDPAKAVVKIEQVVVLDQSPEAKLTAKLALEHGKFVAWVHSGPLDAFGRANARGRARSGSWGDQTRRWIEIAEELGAGACCLSGRPLSEELGAILREVEPSEPARRAAQALISSALCESAGGTFPLLALEKLRRITASRPSDLPDCKPGDPEKLSQVAGLPPAAHADLERLARRLRDPSGRGALLHGLPGTGKTMLAKILARESGRHWIGCSYGEWQACEHLGQHLEAMGSSFQEAIDRTPSLIFIDEIDSVGSRARSSPRNQEYSAVVINSMLEWTQRAIEAGVAVIGATNYPEQVDPALTRAGRLGEWIEIPLPDRDGRRDLLAQALPALPEPHTWAARLGRCTPAKISELARSARELRSDRGGGEPGSADVEECLGHEIGKTLRGRDLSTLAYPVALGLCAKAWSLRSQGSGSPQAVELCVEPGLEEMGRVELDRPFVRGDGASAWSRLQAAMAPAAARVEAARSAASLSSPGALACLADLDERDREEAQACLFELVRCGMTGDAAEHGGSHWIEPSLGLPGLANRAWSQALSCARQALPRLEEGARALAKRRRMGASELWAAMGVADASPPPRAYLH